jgi:hypothetical protein
MRYREDLVDASFRAECSSLARSTIFRGGNMDMEGR